jgi:hypothetical protein
MAKITPRPKGRVHREADDNKTYVDIVYDTAYDIVKR